MGDCDVQCLISWLEEYEECRCYLESHNGNMDDISYHHGFVDGISAVLQSIVGMSKEDVLRIKLRAETQARRRGT